MSTQKLNLTQIRDHWQNWATTYKTDLRATTKTSTAKQIEIATLIQTVKSLEKFLPLHAQVLEIGCGNGYNLISLYEVFSKYHYTGIDFIDEMISSAKAIRDQKKISPQSICFQTGNVLDLKDLPNDYDLIFTVRCLINLNDDKLQFKAIKEITAKIKKNGYFLMLENSQASYNKQNNLRDLVGLKKRTPAEFNHFVNDATISQMPQLGLKKVQVKNFTALHDLILYVLLPMINGGKVDYEHPLIQAATKLSLVLSQSSDESLGDFGQNRLYLFQKQ